jgi:hypothetical protein
MAFAENLRSFMENRLQAFDPTIDLSPNSSAQLKIIQPLLDRAGADPFSVDIPTFMRDRLVQEYPELAADGAGLLEDLFTKPFQLLLEPFLRAVEEIKINQSTLNASLMSDEEADAYGANFFADREEGDFAGGVVRVYFAAPTTVRITSERQFTSRSGLSYFPNENVFISSQQMLFQREGDLFFVDVSVRAEQAGESYNIGPNEIISVEGVEGAVRVRNLSAFVTGLRRETNEEYLGRLPQTLTERSLVTKRGVLTRVPSTFAGDVRALQVVGAGEEGMDRDVLKGTGEGFLHLLGSCSFFLNWVIIDQILYKDHGPNDDVVIQEGDTIRLILRFSDDSTRTSYSAVVTDFISTNVGASNEKYVLILDRTIETLIGTSGSGAVVSVFKPGYITISGVPGGMSSSITVPSDVVHLGGHTDVFVRPSSEESREGVLPNLTDEDPLLSSLGLITNSGTNTVTLGVNLVAAGVAPGDVLVIETGTSAGSYKILSVGSPDPTNILRVDSIFEVTESDLRARIVKNIKVDLVEPKVRKVPFQSGPVSDLQTSVGSTLFRLSTVNIQSLGAEIGDTIRILDGFNAGDYVIAGFDPVLGGQGPIVDRAASVTSANQSYEVFTVSDGLEFPLVRVNHLELLDSTNQGTGITIPYGDAVDIRPICNLEGADSFVRVLDKQIIVCPDASDLWGADGSGLTQTFGNVTSSTSDTRYSKDIEIADGRVRTAASHASNPITETEINLPPFLFNGRRDTIMAFDTREDPEFASIFGDHRTSDIAEASIGDSLVILDGPNKGSYTIQDLRVMDMWSKNSGGHRRIALVQLDQELKVDVLKTVIDYIADVGAASAVTADELAEMYEDSTDFFNSNFWNTVILGRLLTTLTSQGFSVTSGEVEELLKGLATSGYEIGSSTRGTFRLLFLEPVSIEFYFDANPTFFQAVFDSSLRYRIRPDLPPAQIFPESVQHTPPTEWNRDLVLKESDTTRGYLLSSPSFVLRGIRDGDVIEYHPSINDLPSRKEMQSSWLFVTSAGSNIVRGIFSGPSGDSDVPDNLIDVEPGHLFFIDSGPDTGAFVITEVMDTDFSADPPLVRFKVDRTLTHSTSVYPNASNRDFKSYVNAVVSTDGNSFPMALTGLTLSVTFESLSFGPVTTVHTFGAGPFNGISDITSSINADVAFTGSRFEAIADGDELVLRSLLTEGPREYIRVNASSTGVSPTLLRFSANQSDGEYLGALALEGTKKIYGSGLSGFLADQWVSVYAARSPSIIAAGEDEEYLGTFRVVSAGAEVGGPRDGLAYVEIDRSDDFPSTAEVRWVRLNEDPSITPSDTSGGGKDLSLNYVRGRMYKEVSQELYVGIPWSALVNPIDSSSEEQIEFRDFSGSPVDIILGMSNYNHKMPYRILRNGVVRISSTTMSQNRDGALYFIDLPVIGVGTSSDLNINRDIGLVLDGRYDIAGYTLSVQDPIFSFSTREQVSIVLPVSVLPVGSSADLDNEFVLTGQNLQVNYDTAPLVANIQRFFDSPLDRVVVANTLVRHFLPSYVFLDVTYSGIVDTDVVAQELIKYINNIDPDSNELSSNEISKIVNQYGARARQPITLIALTHGTDRRIRGSQSKDIVGGDNLPTFQGNFKQVYFIAGPNTSDEEVRPSGEQVYLIRR